MDYCESENRFLSGRGSGVGEEGGELGMKQISSSESFLGEDKRLSYFDVVHPLFK